MLEKKVKYVDYMGKEREESFFFNLSKAETIMWLTTTGEYTLDKVILRLAEERNGKKIMETFEDLMRRSYGKPSLDWRKFEKTEEIWLDFRFTEAYSNIFSELVTDAKKAAAFINAIIPKEMADEIAKTFKENKEGIPDNLKEYVVPTIE